MKPPTWTHLNRLLVKQRFRSTSTYLLQASTAGGFDRTAVREADPTRSTPLWSISLTMYTPVHSFPCVPPHTATRDSGGRETNSIWKNGREIFNQRSAGRTRWTTTWPSLKMRSKSTHVNTSVCESFHRVERRIWLNPKVLWLSKPRSNDSNMASRYEASKAANAESMCFDFFSYIQRTTSRLDSFLSLICFIFDGFGCVLFIIHYNLCPWIQVHSREHLLLSQ